MCIIQGVQASLEGNFLFLAFCITETRSKRPYAAKSKKRQLLVL